MSCSLLKACRASDPSGAAPDLDRSELGYSRQHKLSILDLIELMEIKPNATHIS
jgi:hypothetical protein